MIELNKDTYFHFKILKVNSCSSKEEKKEVLSRYDNKPFSASTLNKEIVKLLTE